MFGPLLSSVSTALAIPALMAIAPMSVAGQVPGPSVKKPAATPAAPVAGARKFVAKHLPWGDPDISGNFTTKEEANTPFERPDEWAGRRIEDITPAELSAAIKKRQRQALEDAPFVGGGSKQRGVAITEPIHWFDNLDSINSRPWFVTDPPDGKIPPVTPEAQRRAADLAAARATRGAAESYTDRGTGDRCIAWSLPISRPIPIQYGNSAQILQTKDYVAIRYEMVHETRIVPLEGRGAVRSHNRSTFRSYWGDAIGRWEGDTLVVDTTNYKSTPVFRGSSPELHTIERFTRVAPNRVEWSATIDDPRTWSRPWTFTIPWTEDDTQPIFEYACHEGNYALRNILSAGRSDDRKGIKSTNSVDAQLGESEQ